MTNFKNSELNLVDVPRPANVNHANTKIEAKRDMFLNVLKNVYQTYINGTYICDTNYGLP